MEIIKKGRAHLAEVWRCKCPMCDTEVKIIKGDPDIIKYHNCQSSFREEVTWECPVCKTEVLSATGEHRTSAWTNVISKQSEVLSHKEKELLDSWDCLRECINSDTRYYIGKWDSNH